jgi:hypothetical protein
MDYLLPMIKVTDKISRVFKYGASNPLFPFTIVNVSP